MKKLLLNIGKAAVVGAVVGIALSYALPVFAAWLGMDVAATVGAMASAKWMAVFVGGFSAATAAVTPLVDRIFGKTSTESTQTTTIEKAAVEVCHAPELAQGGGIFCGRIEAERAQPGSGAHRSA